MHFEHHDLNLWSKFFQNIIYSNIANICRWCCHMHVLYNSARELLKWVARRCALLMAPVGVLVEIALHVRHHDGRCSLSLSLSIYIYIYEYIYNTRARRTRSSFRRSLLVVFSLALLLSFETRFVSAGALLSTLPALPLCISSLPAALCSRLCSQNPLYIYQLVRINLTFYF